MFDMGHRKPSTRPLGLPFFPLYLLFETKSNEKSINKVECSTQSDAILTEIAQMKPNEDEVTGIL